MHSPGRYSEESSLNNISVKTCEKHSNSAQNSVKATDIGTNATDVEAALDHATPLCIALADTLTKVVSITSLSNLVRNIQIQRRIL